jgi:hypothetical protein
MVTDPVGQGISAMIGSNTYLAENYRYINVSGNTNHSNTNLVPVGKLGEEPCRGPSKIPLVSRILQNIYF